MMRNTASFAQSLVQKLADRYNQDAFSNNLARFSSFPPKNLCLPDSFPPIT